MIDQAPEALWIPLYGLAYVPDPKTFAVPDEQARESLLANHSAQEILAIDDAITWAIAHPDFPFLETFAHQLPPIDYDNPLIISYLKKLQEGMKAIIDNFRAKTP
jgi:hypothetical protein